MVRISSDPFCRVAMGPLIGRAPQSFDEYNDEDSLGYSSSFPNDMGYGDDVLDGTSPASDNNPRILLMGLRRCAPFSLSFLLFIIPSSHSFP